MYEVLIKTLDLQEDKSLDVLKIIDLELIMVP